MSAAERTEFGSVDSSGPSLIMTTQTWVQGPDAWTSYTVCVWTFVCLFSLLYGIKRYKQAFVKWVYNIHSDINENETVTSVDSKM